MPRRVKPVKSLHKQAVEYIQEHPANFDVVYHLAAAILESQPHGKPIKRGEEGTAVKRLEELSSEEASQLDAALVALKLK